MGLGDYGVEMGPGFGGNLGSGFREFGVEMCVQGVANSGLRRV